MRSSALPFSHSALQRLVCIARNWLRIRKVEMRLLLPFASQCKFILWASVHEAIW